MEVKFRLGSIPVRIEPGFWLLSAVLGWSSRGLRDVVLWVLCVLVGVLIHEIGHALAARAFGGQPEITLYAMGGLTHTKVPSSTGRAASLLIDLAGPLAGFLLGAIVYAVALIALTPGGQSLSDRAALLSVALNAPNPTIPSRVVQNLLWINLGWGAINLLPVLPLDGGNVARVLLGAGDTGWIRALVLSLVTGPIVAAVSLWKGMTWAALLFALFSVSAGRQLLEVATRELDRRAGHDDRIRRAQSAFDQREFAEAAQIVEPVVLTARNASLRQGATYLHALALLESGEPEKALKTLERVTPSAADESLRGVCHLEAGHPAEALLHLETAVRQGAGGQTWSLLAEAAEQTGDSARAEQARARARELSETNR